MRTTLGQLRLSRIPQALGACVTDNNRLLSIVNEAQQRLVFAGGESGWWGTWQWMAFNMVTSYPYITVPRSVARLINMSVCKHPIRIQNQFYEFLDAGYGNMPSSCNCDLCDVQEAYDRGSYPTNLDLVATGNPKKIQVYATDARDYNKRILIQGTDQNDVTIRSLDNGVDIQGFMMTLATPFVESAMVLHSITGIQKDITVDRVLIYEADTITGTLRLLSTMEPGEQVASYRRYFINRLPTECCTGTATIQIQALAKLEFIPVAVDTDYLMIGNLPALKLECEAVRYSEMDTDKAQQLAVLKHAQAVRMLNKELEHYLGRERPALKFSPFGSATLEAAGVTQI